MLKVNNKETRRTSDNVLVPLLLTLNTLSKNSVNQANVFIENFE